MVPVYLASLTGPGIFQPSKKIWRPDIFFHSASFVAGFAIVFTLVGAGLGLAGFAFSEHVVLIRSVSGSLMIVFGVLLLANQKITWLNFEKRLQPRQARTTGYVRSMLNGALFAVAWTPCVGPVLGGILMLAMESRTAARGAGLLAVFSLGVGLPFIAIGAAFGTLTPFLGKIKKYSTIFYIIAAMLLILVGVLILTNHLSFLQGAR
jgi:cytochrome c-type biogenesis protein